MSARDLTTGVTGEPIEPGRIGRMKLYTGLWPVLIDSVTPRGCIQVKPMRRDGEGWEAPRTVRADDVWYLLTDAEVKSADLPRRRA